MVHQSLLLLLHRLAEDRQPAGVALYLSVQVHSWACWQRLEVSEGGSSASPFPTILRRAGSPWKEAEVFIRRLTSSHTCQSVSLHTWEGSEGLYRGAVSYLTVWQVSPHGLNSWWEAAHSCRTNSFRVCLDTNDHVLGLCAHKMTVQEAEGFVSKPHQAM